MISPKKKTKQRTQQEIMLYSRGEKISAFGFLIYAQTTL